MTDMSRVVAVVVAYNRRMLLMECLEALSSQSRHLDAVVVVDNASTDGSADLVAERFPDVDLVRLAMNTGGAGGFAVGIERAIDRHDADLVWIMDDDTVPTSSALAELLRARGLADVPPVVQASKVVWTDGTEHPMNTPKRRILAGAAARARAGMAGTMPIRTASFVSLLVSVDAVRRWGQPVADYFIWNDDFEFTSRLLRDGEGWYTPASVVVHKTARPVSSDIDPGERFYYEVRNKVWLFRRSPGFAWWERLLYMGATVRRWARIVIRSSERGTLRSAFSRGWVDGWRSDPRPNDVVLAPALPPTGES